jgi:hypothetical protein
MSDELELLCLVNWHRDQPEDCARHKLSGICITHHSNWCPFCIAGSDDEDGFWRPNHRHDAATLDELRNHPEYRFA